MWYFTLKVRCKVAPKYLEFYEKKLLQLFAEKDGIWCSSEEVIKPCLCTSDEACICYYSPEYRELPKKYCDLVDLWITLHLSDAYIHQELNGTELTLEIAKSWSELCRVQDEMEEVVKEILVPTTTEIVSCVLKEYDSTGGIVTRRTHYTDMELRNQYFRLSEQIKSLRHVWIDGEIAETRVVYKRSIPAKLQMDLERAYR